MTSETLENIEASQSLPMFAEVEGDLTKAEWRDRMPDEVTAELFLDDKAPFAGHRMGMAVHETPGVVYTASPANSTFTPGTQVGTSAQVPMKRHYRTVQKGALARVGNAEEMRKIGMQGGGGNI